MNNNNQENHPPEINKEFTPSQRLFVALLKEKGVIYPDIKAQFMVKWPGCSPPSRKGVYKMSRIKKLDIFEISTS